MNDMEVAGTPGMKPCPFCGSERVLRYLYDNYPTPRYKVCCFDCSAQMYRGTEEEVTEAWNRRAEDKDLFDAVSNIDWGRKDQE